MKILKAIRNTKFGANILLPIYRKTLKPIVSFFRERGLFFELIKRLYLKSRASQRIRELNDISNLQNLIKENVVLLMRFFGVVLVLAAGDVVFCETARQREVEAGNEEYVILPFHLRIQGGR